MKRGNSGVKFKDLGSSPAKQTKEIKGTSIFGKSPKDFVVDAAKNISGYNAIKGAYDKISGSKTKVNKKGISVNDFDDTVAKEGFSEGAQQIGDNFGRMALKQSMKKVKKPAEKKYMKVKRDLKMKPPYKRPVGPRAEVKPTKKTVPGDVKLDPGYEDPIKIQKVQREGLVPGSQGFNKKAKVNVAKKKGEELLDYTKSK